MPLAGRGLGSHPVVLFHQSPLNRATNVTCSLMVSVLLSYCLAFPRFLRQCPTVVSSAWSSFPVHSSPSASDLQGLSLVDIGLASFRITVASSRVFCPKASCLLCSFPVFCSSPASVPPKLCPPLLSAHFSPPLYRRVSSPLIRC